MRKWLRPIIPPIFFDAADRWKKFRNRNRLFDGDDEAFKRLILGCKVYGEYGCGQSTQWVLANSSAQVYAVDSSLQWVDAVRASTKAGERLKIHWVDTGDVGDWGRPLSYGKRNNFPEYMDWIWRQNPQPDLVLVDGRFRVACFLTSLLRAKPGTLIIFDDYIYRQYYHLIEEIVHKSELSGRQAIFIVPSLTDQQRNTIEGLLNKFHYVMD